MRLWIAGAVGVALLVGCQRASAGDARVMHDAEAAVAAANPGAKLTFENVRLYRRGKTADGLEVRTVCGDVQVGDKPLTPFVVMNNRVVMGTELLGGLTNAQLCP